MNPKVDAWLNKAKQWRAEMEALRGVLLEFPLKEEVKWGKPCYTLDGKNVVLILPFKACCALLFAKGALLDDASGKLVQPTENTQAARQWRITSVEEVQRQRRALRAVIAQAIAVEEAGLEVALKRTEDYAVPEEFQVQLKGSKRLQAAFAALTPGRQRAYLLHFAGAKQSKTRAARVEKWVPRILEGKGLDD